MNFFITEISTYSILLPFAFALLRWKKIHKDYYPFLLLIIAGFINESIGTFVVYRGGSNAIPFNIYSLLEAILVIWQFERWELFKSKLLPLGITISFALVWAIEVLIISNINIFCSYFTVFTAFVITVLTIWMINHLIIRERRNLLKNPGFIISVCFIIYFAYSFIVEYFIITSNGNDVVFQAKVQQIFSITNLFTNLLYTLALIWMPSKIRFSVPY